MDICGSINSKPDCNVRFSDLLVLHVGFVTKNRPQHQQHEHWQFNNMFGHNNNHSDIVQVSQRWGTDETKWTGFDNNQSKALRHCRISTTWYHLRFCKISPIIRYLTKSSSSLTLTVIAFPWTRLPARSRQPALKNWIFFYKCNMPCRNIECSSRKSWSKQQLLSLKEFPSHFSEPGSASDVRCTCHICDILFLHVSAVNACI